MMSAGQGQHKIGGNPTGKKVKIVVTPPIFQKMFIAQTPCLWTWGAAFRVVPNPTELRCYGDGIRNYFHALKGFLSHIFKIVPPKIGPHNRCACIDMDKNMKKTDQ